jgi:hypothetical protein
MKFVSICVLLVSVTSGTVLQMLAHAVPRATAVRRRGTGKTVSYPPASPGSASSDKFEATVLASVVGPPLR